MLGKCWVQGYLGASPDVATAVHGQGGPGDVGVVQQVAKALVDDSGPGSMPRADFARVRARYSASSPVVEHHQRR